MDLRSPARLEPAGLPGRGDRKARDFQLEIRRLREEGYSLDAIRAALADAGVRVSKSTVHREAIRRSTKAIRPATQMPPMPQMGPVTMATKPVTPDPAVGLTPHIRSSKEIAREFFDGRITNPLILARGRR